ncbi:MAG: protein kinase, partial [Kofleriaceae bacterium]
MGCLSDTEIVELIDGRPATADRARIVAHLDDCATCRQLVGVAAHNEARPARLALAPGDAVGQRYLVRAAIGAGAMGVVYRATDPRLSRDVALKLLDPRHTPDEPISPRLLAEAHALARLSHPNVVAIHDVGTHADRVFLAMELGEETFAAWLRRAARTPPEILRLLRQAGEGLAAAHATGLIHRDFKPANIIIGFDGRAAITDFGLARSHDGAPPVLDDDAALDAASLTSTGALVGTPAYMAPEQL